jgi:hypothetical protein
MRQGPKRLAEIGPCAMRASFQSHEDPRSRTRKGVEHHACTLEACSSLRDAHAVAAGSDGGSYFFSRKT